ncbi:hypothetical protein [uncultured Alistipes sp.]|nr:hypothetical protein [uncultured Alistipes sp.]
MQNPDTSQKIIVKTIFESKLQIPFIQESIDSIPNYGLMEAIENLAGALNETQKNKFYEIIDMLQNSIEGNPYYSEIIKKEAKTYASAIKAAIWF